MSVTLDKIPVAALVRVSTKEQAADDRAGIPRQKEVIRRAAEIHGLNIVHTIELSDVSGTATAQTPEVQRMMDMLRGQSIKGVVVADLDRLVRPERFGDFALLDIFKDTGAKLYSGSRILDFSDDATFMVGGIEGLFAGMERRMIKKRMQDAKEEKRKRGKHPNSTITLPRGIGYDRKAEKFTLTTGLADVMEAFRIVDEEGNSNLCAVGRRVGIQSRTLADLLRNPIYTGWRVYDKKRGLDKYSQVNGRQSDRKKVVRSANDIIRVKVIDPAPVAQERFDRVQSILKEKKTSWRKQRDNKAIFMATGLARCGICGDRIYTSSGKKKGRVKPGYYYCKRNHYQLKKETGGCRLENIRQDVLDETLIQLVAKYLSDANTIKSLVDAHVARTSQPPTSTGEINQAILRENGKKLERLTDIYLAGAIDIDEFTRRKSRLELERQNITTSVDKHKPVHSQDMGDITRLIVRGAISFGRMTSAADRKVVLDGMLSQVDVTNDGVTGFSVSPHFYAYGSETGTRTDTDSSPPPA